MAVVRVPTPLQRLVGNQRSVSAAGATLAELIDDLDRQYPGMKARLIDDQGRLLSFVNVFINNEDVRFSQGLDTPVPVNAEVSIVPAMAGGF
jgi:molybdopterin converting factor small subunit